MRGDDDISSQDEALAAFGLMTERPAQQHFEVWEENGEVLDVFLACETQWRHGSMTGRLIGLDYQGLRAALDLMEIKDKKQTFEDLRLMERAVIDEVNKDGK